MNVFEEVRQKAVAEAENILLGPILTEKFNQYIHRDIGITHCKPCMDCNRRVFETGTERPHPLIQIVIALQSIFVEKVQVQSQKRL